MAKSERPPFAAPDSTRDVHGRGHLFGLVLAALILMLVMVPRHD